MIRRFLTLIFFIASANSYAQLPDGTVVPDFTFVDIQGNTQNLYSYLNKGKYVIIDASTTWCGPCWDYHNKKVIDSLYDKHDTPGDTTWKVLFIEVDPSTDSADLHGTSGSTQGDWVTGSNYTIIDPPAGVALSNFLSGYNISIFPTLMMICPNKKILQNTLNATRPLVSGWEKETLNCSIASIKTINNTQIFSIYPNPVTDDINISFYQPVADVIDIKITDLTGRIIRSDHIASSDRIQYNLGAMQKGLYFITISTNSYSRTQKLEVK